MSERLILEIEVPDFNVEGAQEAADEFCNGDVLFIVTEEWMRDEVGVTFVTIPGEKSQNHEFEIESRVCRIVGARIAASPQEGEVG
jgi:hypothetical protein